MFTPPLRKDRQRSPASRYSPPLWRYFGWLGLALLAALALMALVSRLSEAATDRPAVDQDLDVVTLQLKWQHQFQFAGYYAALEQGYYEAAGLDVRIVESTQADESVDKVLSGEADFGIAMSDLVVLRSEGKPVVALATIFQHSPLVILMPGDNGIDSVHDLIGRRLMLESHSAELIAYLQSEGISLSELTLLPHTFDTDSLIRGNVDAMSAYATDEPFELRALGIEYSVFSPRSAGIDFYGDTLFTSEAQLAANPDRVRRFLEASNQGWAYAMANPDQMIELILSDYSQRHSRAHLEFEAAATKRLILADVIEIGYMNPGRWQHVANVYASLDMLPTEIEMEDFLYDPNAPPDLTRVYVGGLALLMLSAVAILIALRFVRLNKALGEQIEQRKRVETQLREQERQLSTLLRNLPGMAYRCLNQPKWPMIFVSRGAEKLTGHTVNQLVSRTEVEYGDLIHPDDRAKVIQEIEAAVEEFRPFRLEYRIIAANGREKWVWEQGIAVYDDAGGVQFIEGFISDISAQRQSAAEREVLITELQKTLREVRTLQGILPICASCKKIRDDEGYWHQVEVYIHDHSEADFSHGICPDCMQNEFPEVYKRMKAAQKEILRVLGILERATKTDMIDATGIPESRISGLLESLVEERKIVHTESDGQHYYQKSQSLDSLAETSPGQARS